MSQMKLLQEYTLAVGLGFIGTTLAGALFIAIELSLPGRTGLNMALAGSLLLVTWVWVAFAIRSALSRRVAIHQAGDPELFVRQDLATDPY